MSKRLSLMFLMAGVVALLASGCVVTDYPIITDDDVCGGDIVDMDVTFGGSSEGKGSDKDTESGKGGYQSDAHIVEITQAALLQTDGTDEGVSDVHQDVFGNQTIYTYTHFCAGSTGAPPIADTFHGDVYCNPMRDATPGCAVATAPNPVVGDTDPFDYTVNTACNGANNLGQTPPIVTLVSYTARTQECGLPMAQAVGILGGENVAASQLSQLMSIGVPTTLNGQELVLVKLNRNTVSGTITTYGRTEAENRTFALDMGQANIALYLRPSIGPGQDAVLWAPQGFEDAAFLMWLADQVGKDGRQGVPFMAKLVVEGISIELGNAESFNLAFAPAGLYSIAEQIATISGGRSRLDLGQRNPVNLSTPHIDAPEGGLR